MSKIRLNQFSQFEIECFVDGVQTWRQAIHPQGDYENWSPDWDEEQETIKEINGEFYITQK